MSNLFGRRAVVIGAGIGGLSVAGALPDIHPLAEIFGVRLPGPAPF
jgi:hypothetical protein